MRTPLLSFLCLGGLVAQEQVDPRCFLVHDYTNVVAVDLAKMRELEVWDELQVSALNIALSSAEKELGFSFDLLDRCTMTMSLPDDEDRQGGKRRMRMFVLEGHDELTTSDRSLRSYEPEQYGAHTLYMMRYGREEGFVRPAPNVQVWGDAQVIKAALDGERKPGLPSADVMSLSVGRGKRIAYMVADLSEEAARNTFLDELFEGSEWPEGDMPTFFAGRVLVTGDSDDPHLTLEVVLRHAKVGDGVAASREAIDALLKRGKEMPQLRLFHKLLEKAETKTSGSDVEVRVDLGRSRDAVGNLAMVIAPLFLFSARAAEAQAVQAVPVQVEVVEEAEPVEEPPPPPPPESKPAPTPEGGGNGGGEGGGR